MSEQSGQRVQRFIDALAQLEERGDPEPIIATYAETCQISNVVAPHVFEGRDGARDFWSTYRGTFGEMKSTFRNVIVAGDHATLEWTTHGAATDGHRIHYDGVSILEYDGDTITRFHAYFDPAKLGAQVKRGDRVGT